MTLSLGGRMLNAETIGRLRVELGEEAYGQLIDTFFSDFAMRLTRLEQYVFSHDRPNLEFETYSVLGAAVNIGLDGVADAARSVSGSALNEDWPQIRMELTQLRLAGGETVDMLGDDCSPHFLNTFERPFGWEQPAPLSA